MNDTPTSGYEDVSADDPRWIAILNRDNRADGKFVYGVKTTGLYCLPSTRSKLPRLKNVEFFSSAMEAEAAGYKFSQRASDQLFVNEQRAKTVAAVQKIINEQPHPPSLSCLAKEVGLSPFHLHRIFKAATGLSPRAFAIRSKNDESPRQKTDEPSEMHPAGVPHSSKEALPQPRRPSRARRGAPPPPSEIEYAVANCSLGTVLIGQCIEGICAILLGDSEQALLLELISKFPSSAISPMLEKNDDLTQRVVDLIEKPEIHVEMSLYIRGTAFQEKIWKELLGIPCGTTASYKEIASMIGSPKAARAVEQACSANSLAVAIPCHRVVRKDGGLTSYPWGIERKRKLLEREALRRRK